MFVSDAQNGEVVEVRCASFNVLFDEYIGVEGSDYSQADPKLLVPGARRLLVKRVIEGLNAHVVAMQEADLALARSFTSGDWRVLWTPKKNGKKDGCLLLVRRGIRIRDFESFSYDDDSGHIAQRVFIGGLMFVNTHIKWVPLDEQPHLGTEQMRMLLKWIGKKPAVLLADCNDLPGGPVRALLEKAEFTNAHDDSPTSVVNGRHLANDIIAVRKIKAKSVDSPFSLEGIPNKGCPSDHIPVFADVEIPYL